METSFVHISDGTWTAPSRQRSDTVVDKPGIFLRIEAIQYDNEMDCQAGAA